MKRSIKKAIVVSNYFYPEMGAASSRIYNLALAFTRSGIDVICSLPNYPKGEIFKEYKWRIFKKEDLDNTHACRYWIYPTVKENTFAT